MRVIVQTLGASHKLSILSKNFNQLSSLFDQEQGKSKELSSIHVYQLSSTFILFYQKQRKVKTTLIQTLVYQLALVNSHLCLTRSRESQNNSHKLFSDNPRSLIISYPRSIKLQEAWKL